jgi:uncharacterized protein YbjT (DUF2867 family)
MNFRINEMKKVLIIGATGSLATYVIDELNKNKDVHLTLFARNSRKLNSAISSNCNIVEGDALNYNSVKNAVAGQDIVYINLAGNLEEMTRNIVKAMQETGVNRVIATSSIGIYKEPLSAVLIPYRKLADVVEASGLDYTILRPDWFTNGNEVNYAITRKGEPEIGSAVSRKSIASFVASVVADPTKYIGENLGISKL